MSLIAVPVPSLIQGVSQQPAAERLSSQCEAMDDCYPSVVDGLQKRHPTQHIVKAITGDAGPTKVHIVNRDSSERYVLLFRDGDIKAFTVGGLAIPVKGATFPYVPDFSYLTGAIPSKIRALTVADYTLVANLKKVTALSGATTAADPSRTKAFLFIEQTNYKADFTVKLQRTGDIVQTVSISTWDGTASGVNVKEIWRIDITATGAAGGVWDVNILGNHATFTNGVGESVQSIASGLSLAITALTNVAAEVNDATITVIADSPGLALVPFTVTPPAGGAATATKELDGAAQTELNSIKSNDIAQRLAAKLNALPGYVAGVVGSVIKLTSSTNLISLDTTSSLGDSGLVRIWGNVENFSDLPLICEDGYKVRILGDTTQDADDYYAKFVSDAPGQFGKGKWIETVGYSVQSQLDASTMPWQLVRKQDDGGGTVTGTPNQLYFEWSQVAWNAQACGDSSTNPAPSFIGKTIADIFFFRNRLGLLADQNVILSEASRYFNFFRTTITTLVDSDPIDVSAAHVSVSLLHAAVPLDERLVLFSERTQFVLRADSILTPRTVTIKPALEYENLNTVRPVPTARGIFFAHRRGSFTGMRDLFPVDNVDKLDAEVITAHVPKYIAGTAVELATSSLEDMLFVLGDEDPSVLFAYKHFWQGQNQVQSAWGRYRFGSGASVRGMGFIENDLYLVIQRTAGLFIERMTIAPGQADDNASYVTYLDRRIDDTQLVSRVYSIVTDATTLTLPYALEAGETTQVVTRCTAPDNGGAILQVISSGGSTIVVSGDHHADALWIGQRYTKRYEFSKPALRQPTNMQGAQTLVATGRYQLLWGTVVYSLTGFFQVEVTPLNRDTYVYPFGRILGSGNNLIGQVAFESGVFRFPILCKSDETTIVVTNNSPLPSNLQAAEWEANFYSKSSRFRG